MGAKILLVAATVGLTKWMVASTVQTTFLVANVVVSTVSYLLPNHRKRILNTE